jgi:hypothetical protein
MAKSRLLACIMIIAAILLGTGLHSVRAVIDNGTSADLTCTGFRLKYNLTAERSTELKTETILVRATDGAGTTI